MKYTTNLRIGFIGLGNMGGAVAEGLLRAGISGEQMYACGGHYDKLLRRCRELSEHAGAETMVHPCKDAAETVQKADIIFIAVKPAKVPEVLRPIRDELTGKLLISVVWGYDLKRYQEEDLLPDSAHILCTIPNTPVSVCRGIFITENATTLTEEEQTLVQELLQNIAMIVPVESSRMNIGGIIGGCAPAFVDVFMEALADAAVMYGIPRDTAYPLVSRMLEGTACLQLESGRHPAAMKDDVCSPSGATIRGIASLEEHGFRGTVIQAVKSIHDL